MRSLATKLTIAFFIIGILGSASVAVLTLRSTQRAFDRFVNSLEREQIESNLVNYYTTNNGWEGVEIVEHDTRRLGGFMLIDTSGDFVLGTQEDQTVFPNEIPLEVEGEPIGTLFIRGSRGSGTPPPQQTRVRENFSAENVFIDNIYQASLLSAGVAVVLALITGTFMSRRLTLPIRALTKASQTMASGDLGTQVDVSGNDEIGRLANAFNDMSSDLAEARRKRQQLTADIAHDLGTPLSILRGYTEGLKDGSLQGSRQIFNVMYEEVEHLEHLVKDLRILSLADAGELPLNKREVHPKALLERTGLAYVMRAEKQGIGLRIDAPEKLPTIKVDGERITQVLNNLVSNALRYTDRGEIVLGASADNGCLNLKVSDTGCGIAPDALPHIFDRFYRADVSRHREHDGTVSSGLGLAIAKALVNAHDGAIAVDSVSAEMNPTNSGTQFIITFPVT